MQVAAPADVPVVNGDDMYLLAGQHPYLAVLVPREVNAFLSPFRDSHVLPHKVRLNPLSLNTVDHKQGIQRIKDRSNIRIRKK